MTPCKSVTGKENTAPASSVQSLLRKEGEDVLGNGSRAHPVQHPQGSTGSSGSVPWNSPPSVRTECPGARSAPELAPAEQQHCHCPWPDLWGAACHLTSGSFVLNVAFNNCLGLESGVFSPINFLSPFLPCFSLVLVFVFFWFSWF